jgi:p-cymene monooxygenase
MWEYTKYYLAPVTQLLAMLGLYLGGDYVWIGLAQLPLMAVVDTLLPLDFSARKMRNKGLAFVPVWISTLLGPALLLVLAWSVAAHDLSGVQLLGAVISCGWLSVMPLVPAAHELYHARGRIGRTVGRYAQVCYLDSTRMEAHVVSHHRDVGTADDSDSAARGETLYSFAPKAVLESTLLAQRIESDALEKRGYGRWNIRHHIWRALLAQLLFQSMIFAIGGWHAVGVVLCTMLLARFWIETFNYFQHYGQVRVEGTPIEKRHVWNHFGSLSRLVAFEITNHADHHLNSYLSYYELVPHKESVRMPSVFTCFFAALVPPVWFNMIIKPALKEWDNDYASLAEQKLAAQQNRDAGWEEWLKPQVVAAR